MTSDGALLAIATLASVKIFQLRPRKTQRHAIKFTKLACEPKIAALGARAIQFSNDGRWLCIITPESRVHLLHILAHRDDGQIILRIELPSKSLKLKRKERAFTSSKKLTLKDGVVGLGEDYGRQIHNIAFSPNSTLLSVSDLAGFIDCWERDESDTWNSLTTKASLPRLDAPALSIGFRPSASIPQPTTPEQLAVEDSIIELDEDPPSTSKSTSLQLLHQQHQQIVEITSDEHHGLFVLTSAHTLHEFDVKQGTLTEWSKRNPSENLPQNFKKNMDRASGMNFMVDKEKGLRLWLWGASWVWMFNIDRDLVLDITKSLPHPTGKEDNSMSSTLGTKRKRLEQITETSKVFMSGAGSRIPVANENERVRTHGRDSKLKAQNVNPIPLSVDQESDNDATEDFLLDVVHSEKAPNFSSLSIVNTLVNENGDDEDNTMDLTSDDNDAEMNNNALESMGTALTKGIKNMKRKQKEKLSWSTNKYRPLMAFLPIGNSTDGRTEMVIVERPLYDIALPPRFEDKRDTGR